MAIDPRAHMNARATNGYEATAKAGVLAVIEPHSGSTNRAPVCRRRKLTMMPN
jgi:predicted metal-dependent TIM-barrel fold hydrolase